MKGFLKSKLLASAMILGTAAQIALPAATVSADTGGTTPTATTANKSASVTVKAGPLEITPNGGSDSADRQAPSFRFADTDVSESAQNGLKATGFNNEINTDDTYTGSKLSVTDLTGSGSGWHVSAKLGTFTDNGGKGYTLPGATLNMVGADTTGTGKSATAALVADGDAQSVYSADANAGGGTNVTDLKGSTLDLPQATQAGHFIAPLTYTLSAGPTANPGA